MDNLTHGLVGALMGQAGLKRKTGLAMPALIFGANLPDIDAGCVVWGTPSLAMRRGLTHGPIAWVLLPLVLAGFLWWFDRWQTSRGTRPDDRLRVRFGWLYALAFTACLTHPALDWMNNYGIRLLEPFSHRWFYGDVLFIIDVWLWATLGLGLWLSLRREKHGRTDAKAKDWRTPAWLALLIGVGYIAGNISFTRSAERMQEMNSVAAIASPVPLTFWRRDLIFVHADGRHRILRGYDGPDNDMPPIEQAGNVPLEFCDLKGLARENLDVAAYLFWSRAPLVERGEDGSLTLQDARMFGQRTGGQFSVSLPPETCIAM